MKKILLLSSILASVLFIGKPASAQFSASINLGIQPEWGPSGYDYAENYYLPDVEAYYNVPSRQFVYFDRGRWIYSSSLPGRCGNYDLYSGYKVVLNGHDPWCHFNEHRAMYAPYRFRHDQVVIRDFRGGYGRGGYYDNRRPGFDNRNRGRDWGYGNRNDHYDRRQDMRRDNDRDNDHRNDRNDRGNGRGRW